MRFLRKFCLIFAILAVLAGGLCSCDQGSGAENDAPIKFVEITNAERITLLVGDSFTLEHNIEDEYAENLTFSATGSAVEVSGEGVITAVSEGKSSVTATYAVGDFTSSDTILVTVEEEDTTDRTVFTPEISGAAPTLSGNDPYAGVSKTEFYRNYTPAKSWEDAYYRSQHGLLSGSITVPDQMHQPAVYQPKKDGMYIKNTSYRYEDGGKTYIVTDSQGNEVLRIYQGGGYITLEEVAAYMIAFGGSADSIPANYTSKKSGKPASSIWGEYLRVNHSYFSGNTSSYPYEPVLPNISGCGGSLQYYEMDIGTTGTKTPTQTSGQYNNGTKIIRGAARLVYGRRDINGNCIFERNEIYVFYTYNHYNDFVEYLNYFGGWGKVFGNTTGGGVFDSETKYNPTPYPEVYWGRLSEGRTADAEIYIFIDTRKIWEHLTLCA